MGQAEYLILLVTAAALLLAIPDRFMHANGQVIELTQSAEETVEDRPMCLIRNGSYAGIEMLKPSNFPDAMECAYKAMDYPENDGRLGCTFVNNSAPMECFGNVMEEVAICLAGSDVSAAKDVLMRIVRNALLYLCIHGLSIKGPSFFNECEVQFEEDFLACDTLELDSIDFPSVTQFNDDQCRQVLEARACRKKVMKPCAGHRGASLSKFIEVLWSPIIYANDCEKRVTVSGSSYEYYHGGSTFILKKSRSRLTSIGQVISKSPL